MDLYQKTKRELRYRITMEDPLPLGRSIPSPHVDSLLERHHRGPLYIPGSSIMGAIRAAFRNRYQSEQETDHELFGGHDSSGHPIRGKFVVSVLKLEEEHEPEPIVILGVGDVLPPGAVFVGDVRFDALRVFRADRQLPEMFVHFFTAFDDFVNQFLVIPL